jgi:hypothetical protein
MKNKLSRKSTPPLRTLGAKVPHETYLTFLQVADGMGITQSELSRKLISEFLNIQMEVPKSQASNRRKNIILDREISAEKAINSTKKDRMSKQETVEWVSRELNRVVQSINSYNAKLVSMRNRLTLPYGAHVRN